MKNPIETGTSQMHRIYRCLARRMNKWVAMPALARAASPNASGIGLSPRSRICDLRRTLKDTKSKLRIEHKERRDGLTRKTWYRLVKST